MSGVYRGVCGRRCCYSPFVECIREGKCECHRDMRSPFQKLVDEARRLQEREGK